MISHKDYNFKKRHLRIKCFADHLTTRQPLSPNVTWDQYCIVSTVKLIVKSFIIHIGDSRTAFGYCIKINDSNAKLIGGSNSNLASRLRQVAAELVIMCVIAQPIKETFYLLATSKARIAIHKM